MRKKLRLGLWRYIINMPPSLWEKQISKAKRKLQTEYSLLSKEHHSVHHFIVRELPYVGKPLPPESVADRLDIPVDRVRTILDDLEEGMTFLFRNNNGEVVWAYPVTVDKTPHHVSFNTGEELYAA
ncbi:MAG: hypothetical protein MUO68_16150 [Desulfobacteraceae bacterium]|nr:hypothetical protein [Desulfobacteraceae bacterium]